MSSSVKWRYKSPSCAAMSIKTDDKCLITWCSLCLYGLGSCCLGPWLRKWGWSPRRSRISQSTHAFISLGKTICFSIQSCTKHEIILQGVTTDLVSSGHRSCLALVEIQGREVSEEKGERQSLSLSWQTTSFILFKTAKWFLILVLTLVGQRIKNLPAVQETQIWSLGWGDALEKEVATHSCILAWRIPWTKEPGGLQSMGSQRTGSDFHSFFCTFLVENWENREKWKEEHLRHLQAHRGRTVKNILVNFLHVLLLTYKFTKKKKKKKTSMTLETLSSSSDTELLARLCPSSWAEFASNLCLVIWWAGGFSG